MPMPPSPRSAPTVNHAHDDAVAEVGRCSGVHFGPQVAEAFLSIPVDVFEEVRAEPFDELQPFQRDVPSFRSPTTRNTARASRAG
jgi:hypothetical protein